MNRTANNRIDVTRQEQNRAVRATARWRRDVELE